MAVKRRCITHGIRNVFSVNSKHGNAGCLEPLHQTMVGERGMGKLMENRLCNKIDKLYEKVVTEKGIQDLMDTYKHDQLALYTRMENLFHSVQKEVRSVRMDMNNLIGGSDLVGVNKLLANIQRQQEDTLKSTAMVIVNQRPWWKKMWDWMRLKLKKK